MNERLQSDDVSAIASLSDPTRRSLFNLVCESSSAVGRDEAAAALGIPRATVAFHLDRLVETRLLESEFQRRAGRTGPGAGRPAKYYRRATAEIVVTLPERHYDLAADLLSSAVEKSDRTGEPVRQALMRVSLERGRALGREAGSFDAVLQATGYEPRNDGEGGVVLTNCPFGQLSKNHAETICQANLALLQGALLGAGEIEHQVHFDPAETRCCVRLAATSGGAHQPC